MYGQPIDVTILPATPGSGYALAIYRDPFASDEVEDGIGDYADLGPVIAWRFESYFSGSRVHTVRRPVGTEEEPGGEDWTTEVHDDLATHRSVLAALGDAAAAFECRHLHDTTTTEENPS